MQISCQFVYFFPGRFGLASRVLSHGHIPTIYILYAKWRCVVTLIIQAADSLRRLTKDFR